MKTKHLLLSVLSLGLSLPVFSQNMEAPAWYIGLSGGYHATFPNFTKIDKDFYPKTTNRGDGVYGIFVEGEFGKNRQFAVRPELMFTTRGGGLKNIGINQLDYYEEGIEDIFYKVKSHYIDIRVPLIYNIGTYDWVVRPYVYVAPILGFSTGGNIRLQATYEDCAYEGYAVDLNKSNYNSVYFAGAVALGARYHFPLGSSKAFVGLELMYEYGFTDTYGSNEKKGDAININPWFPANAKVEGTRKYQGLEAKVTLGIPFDAFKRKPQPQPQPVVVTDNVYEETVEVSVPEEEDKPCYSLDEIVDLMAKGKNVYGKTICAIDDDINFAFGQATINPTSYNYLNRLAETLKRTNANIKIKGHTDNIGTEEFNMNLSKNRAENVAKYLINRGVPSSRLVTEYYGMSDPIDTNDTEEGRARNRRVEFEINN